MRKSLVIGGSATAALVLIGGAAWGIGATTLTPEPETTQVVSVVEPRGSATPTVAPTLDVVTPEPVVEPAPIVEAPEPSWGNYPSGYPVPFVASSDPENANGGEWAVAACASGSATTGGDGRPYCD